MNLIARSPQRARHGLVATIFVFVSVLLCRPEVILVSKAGFTAWYPATGLGVAFMLGISPWYLIPICLTDLISNLVTYHDPMLSFSRTIGVVGIAIGYAAAAHVLRDPLAIDLRLRYRRDVFFYILVTMPAILASTIIGVVCLRADHLILADEVWPSAFRWFVGDGVAVLGVAPFFLIHVLPWVRSKLSPTEPPVPVAVRHHVNLALTIAEAVLQAAALLAVLWVVFGPRWGHLQLLYLCFIPVIWIAMRQGIRRVVTGTLLLNFGIVVALYIFPPSAALLAEIDVLMIFASGAGLIMGSSVSERHRMALQLKRQAKELMIEVEERQHAEALMREAKEAAELAREVLRFQATHDGLTGVCNRNEVMACLEREVQRASRTKQPISVLMIDVDHFKQVNDTYGHMAGDQVLKEVADCLKAAVRTYDVVGRYGGEEFVIIMPASDEEQTMRSANRLRMRVEASRIAIDNSEISVTVSIGVASASSATADQDLLLIADKAVYEAKRTGRNRVVVARTDKQATSTP